jgi:hypothetical protein
VRELFGNVLTKRVASSTRRDTPTTTVCHNEKRKRIQAETIREVIRTI